MTTKLEPNSNPSAIREVKRAFTYLILSRPPIRSGALPLIPLSKEVIASPTPPITVKTIPATSGEFDP